MGVGGQFYCTSCSMWVDRRCNAQRCEMQLASSCYRTCLPVGEMHKGHQNQQDAAVPINVLDIRKILKNINLFIDQAYVCVPLTRVPLTRVPLTCVPLTRVPLTLVSLTCVPLTRVCHSHNDQWPNLT